MKKTFNTPPPKPAARSAASPRRPLVGPLPLLCGLALLLARPALGQSVGIGTASPHPAAALDISATDKGLLIPRLDSAQRVAIAAPPDGLLVFQKDFRRGPWYAFGGAWRYIPDAARAAATVPAENGLGKGAGGSIRLGGALDENTALSLNGNALQVLRDAFGPAVADQSSGTAFDRDNTGGGTRIQTFTPGVSGRLGKLTLRLRAASGSSQALTVSIRSGGTVLGSLSTSVVGTGSVAAYDFAPGQPVLTAGTVYVIQVVLPALGWAFNIAPSLGPSAYAGGSGTFGGDSGDYLFSTEMQPAREPVVLAATPAGLGVGTSAPAATLHVGGAASTVLFEGLAGPGTRMLTADATGTLGTAPLPADATTATNGLAEDGNALGLGGPLAGPTTVVLGGFPLRFPNAAALVPAAPLAGTPGSGVLFTTPGNPATANGAQTFTATATGTLTQFEAVASSLVGAINLTLYAGSGIGGTALGTSSGARGADAGGGFQTWRFGPLLPLTAGQVYTALLTVPAGSSGGGRWQLADSNPYAGGAALGSATSDAVFRATVSTGPGLALTPAGVGIGLDAPQQTLHVGGTAGTPNVRLASLAGTGSRLVLADADGDLAAAASASPEALLGWQRGTATLGASNIGTSQKTVTLTFPTAFAAVPGQVLCTVRSQTGQAFNDVFAVTTRTITATGFVANVLRVDQNAAWGQVLLLDWLAMP